MYFADLLHMYAVLMNRNHEHWPTESAKAEAAVWMARLHSDVRSEQTEATFRRWLAASPLHRLAFERMARTWDATGWVLLD